MSSDPSGKTKILILAANPKGTNELRLNEEVREIDEGLLRARHRDVFELESKWAVREQDFYRHLLNAQPQIVHFSGHGGGEQGIVLEDNAGKVQFLQTEQLAALFKLFASKGLRCVVLNACYSEEQAKAISHYVDYVIGMNKAIGDKAAIAFAVSFYDALGAGEAVEFAFEFARTRLMGMKVNEIPVLMVKPTTSALVGSDQPAKVTEPRENITVWQSSPASLPLSIVEQAPLQPQPIVYENPEGQVPLNSVFYVVRPPNERDCYDQIIQPSGLIRVKAPRQMGKTSLMSRIMNFADQQKYRTACLNLQLADAEFLTSLDQFLLWFCSSVADALDLPDKLDDYWKGARGVKARCTNYFKEYLLIESDSPLALGLDEVDEVFKHPEIADGFFSLLRAWHEEKNDPIWQKLRLIITHSKEVYIPLNMNKSPFNVGVPIELPPFTQVQVQELLELHGLVWQTEAIAQLMQLLGGHPYLVRAALYQIARQRMTLEQLAQVATMEEGLYGDHLRRHLSNLQDDSDLLQAMKRVVMTDKPVDVGRETFKLRSMGLVRFHENRDVIPACELYRQYFRDRLGVS